MLPRFLCLAVYLLPLPPLPSLLPILSPHYTCPTSSSAPQPPCTAPAPAFHGPSARLSSSFLVLRMKCLTYSYRGWAKTCLTHAHYKTREDIVSPIPPTPIPEASPTRPSGSKRVEQPLRKSEGLMELSSESLKHALAPDEDGGDGAVVPQEHVLLEGVVQVLFTSVYG